MTQLITHPAHRRLWSGLSSADPAAEVGVLGVPFDNATGFRKGASFAPAKIREITSYLAPSTEEGHRLAGLRVRDYGDVSGDLHWERYFATVETQATQVLRHPLALFWGGDHSATIPLTAAFSQTVTGRFGVGHFDAHPIPTWPTNTRATIGPILRGTGRATAAADYLAPVGQRSEGEFAEFAVDTLLGILADMPR